MTKSSSIGMLSTQVAIQSGSAKGTPIKEKKTNLYDLGTTIVYDNAERKYNVMESSAGERALVLQVSSFILIWNFCTSHTILVLLNPRGTVVLVSDSEDFLWFEEFIVLLELM